MARRRLSPAREHKAVAREAGFGSLSPVSIVAGTLTAYGSFAILAAVVGAIFSAAGADTNFRTNDWTSASAVGGLATALTLFVAYLFGGYVAGRMARRAGMLNGLFVFLLGLVAAGVVGGLVSVLADNQDVNRNLRSIGVPTTASQWGNVGIAAAIASLVLMAAGAIGGGVLGERWHTKLARRAADPDYGPEVAARRRAEEADAERGRVIAADPAVRRDAALVGPNRDDDGDGIDDRSERASAREIDLREDRPGMAPRKAGTGRSWFGRHSSGDEPRYTAAEWAELQRRESAGRR
ncbi:MAG: TIGR04086 family membrane protein [Actinobacteria bacterium]|nr:TIGR04086 family membrane protein [Actinomycetota bacterium]